MTAILPLALMAVMAISLAVVSYAYLAYPAVVYALSRAFGRKSARPAVADPDLPAVTLVVAAYNEAAHIADRVENALAADYPAGKFDVLIASDGSSDGTAALAAAAGDGRVTVLDFPARRGKPAVLNDAIPAARGEVVVLSDANTHMDPSAVRRLAAWFADPAVGAVCGRLVLTDPATGRNVDGLYWKYETFLKECEGRLGALLGSNGGIYALRKSAFAPIPPHTLVDDFVIPLAARARTGCRIVYDRDAVACEETPPSMAAEFHRRARIGAGGFQSIGLLRGLLHPRHGWVAFTFLSHKVARWLGPIFLISLLVSHLALFMISVLNVGDVPQAVGPLLAAHLGFYAVASAGAYLPARPRCLRVLRLPAMFAAMNAALAVGLWRWLAGSQSAAWRRTDRPDGALAGAAA